MDERSFRVAFIHAKEASRAFVCLDESRALRRQSAQSIHCDSSQAIGSCGAPFTLRAPGKMDWPCAGFFSTVWVGGFDESFVLDSYPMKTCRSACYWPCCRMMPRTSRPI